MEPWRQIVRNDPGLSSSGFEGFMPEGNSRSKAQMQRRAIPIGHAGVAGIGLLYTVNGERPDGIDATLFE